MRKRTAPFTRPLPAALALLICTLGLLVFTAGAAAQWNPAELCDGIDNDGNGLIDEGFDTDGDGVARCCGKDPFFVTTDRPTGQKLVAHHRGCASSGFTTAPAPLAEVFGASKIRVNGVADITQNGVLDVVWTEVVNASGTNPRYLATCNGLEWVSQQTGFWDYNYFGGADVDGNADMDFVAWDATHWPMSGAGAGVVAFGFGGSSYAEVHGHYDATPVLGNWGAARVYNLADLDWNGWPDLIFHSYASGGASTTYLHSALNAGGSFGATNPMINQVSGQPQNWGDLGQIDLNRDRCVDWIGGPDDDGDKGSVYALFGDCTGDLPNPPVKVADACIGCAGSGVSHGSGMSQLYDWNCDGQLDLLTSHVVHTGSTATVTYWTWNGNVFSSPTTVLNNAPISSKIASPLRN